MPSKDPILTPELLKIIKIFGAASILLVVVFSFFDSYRANNSGEDRTFRMTSSSRLYFLNLKAINYDRENRNDAGMVLYRHNGFGLDSEEATLILVLILNSQKDESYLYLEPKNIDWPIRLSFDENGQTRQLNLENGNKFDHLEQVTQLQKLLEEEVKLFLLDEDQKIPLWGSESEKDAIKSTFEDYFRIIEN
ncbi:hypothetical protein OU792_13905 [Algoriphagus sp. NF]|jgi:hypothetical protein|uniref:hypothetical protein n=1 Tax=Algoriphagus sp. NF TaxID=2992756 RepID=UPI001064AC8B|nr:hypothetical protein [Algoriphagus sp. NF]MDE0561089.1 hypothetical protein [Algoriphagus sp. NF]